MVLDRPTTDPKIGGDILAWMARQDQIHDLMLAWRQRRDLIGSVFPSGSALRRISGLFGRSAQKAAGGHDLVVEPPQRLFRNGQFLVRRLKLGSQRYELPFKLPYAGGSRCNGARLVGWE